MTAIGYGIGHGLRWLWWFMEFKEPGGRPARWLLRALATLLLLLAAYTVTRMADWQNSIRTRMEMAPDERRGVGGKAWGSSPILGAVTTL